MQLALLLVFVIALTTLIINLVLLEKRILKRLQDIDTPPHIMMIWLHGIKLHFYHFDKYIEIKNAALTDITLRNLTRQYCRRTWWILISTITIFILLASVND